MNAQRQTGMGLVELMVWAAVSLLIVTIIGIIYVNSKRIAAVKVPRGHTLSLYFDEH